jgi:MFS family permease
VALLHGFAFVIFYVTLGLPIGYLADRINRKKLIVASIAFWSLMTAGCGLVKSFGGLFAMRVGVGIGEAGLSPASYSLIADYFPPARRSLALGVYTIALYLGGGMAILIGGLVVKLVGESPSVMVPLLGEMRSWQVVFLIVGLPGLLVALLACTFAEPARRYSPEGKDASAGMTGFVDSWRKMWAHIGRFKKTYLLYFFGFSFLGVPFNVTLLWGRPYLTRHFGMAPADAAYLIGALMLICATLGIVSGSFLADRLQARGKQDATVRVGLIAGCAVLLPMMLFPFLPSISTTAIALGLLLFFGAFAYGAAAAGVQLVTPGSMRAIVSALYLFVVNLVGLMMGPTATGFLADYVFKDPNSIGYAASIVGTVCAALAAIIFAFLLRSYRETLDAQGTRSQ